MTDRKKMLYVGYICLAVCAGGLAILGWLNLLTPVRHSRLNISNRDAVRVQRANLFCRGA